MSSTESPYNKLKPRGGPRSVTRLLDILHCLAAQKESSLASLSQSTHTPKSSLLALLRELVGAGYVSQGENGYSLGTEAFALASVIVAQRKLLRIARPVMQALADETGETILLAEMSADQSYATYVERIEGTQAIRFIANVGDRRELYASSAGRVLLAFQGPEFCKSYFARTKLLPLTKKNAVTRPELIEILSEIKKTRLAVTNEDITEGVAGFASPILDAGGEIIAVLAIAAPVARGQQNAARLGRLVRDAASKLCRVLGYLPDANLAQ